MEETKEGILVHSQPATDPDSFECSFCSWTGSKKSLLKRHIQNHHDESRKFKCNFCEKKSSTKQALINHVELVHLKLYKFECPECKRKCFHGADFIRHVAGVHKMCSVASCRQKFGCYDEVADHLQIQHGRTLRRRSSPKQKKASPDGSLKQRQSLLEPRHWDPLLDEDLCSEIKEEEDQEFKCEICDKGWKNKTALKIHLSSMHGLDFFEPNDDNVSESDLLTKKPTCTICGKVVASKRGLNHHINLVHKMKKQACPFCPKKFFRLKKHIKMKHRDATSAQHLTGNPLLKYEQIDAEKEETNRSEIMEQDISGFDALLTQQNGLSEFETEIPLSEDTEAENEQRLEDASLDIEFSEDWKDPNIPLSFSHQNTPVDTSCSSTLNANADIEQSFSIQITAVESNCSIKEDTHTSNVEIEQSFSLQEAALDRKCIAWDPNVETEQGSSQQEVRQFGDNSIPEDMQGPIVETGACFSLQGTLLESKFFPSEDAESSNVATEKKFSLDNPEGVISYYDISEEVSEEHKAHDPSNSGEGVEIKQNMAPVMELITLPEEGGDVTSPAGGYQGQWNWRSEFDLGDNAEVKNDDDDEADTQEHHLKDDDVEYEFDDDEVMCI